jgi:hypothetical protein
MGLRYLAGILGTLPDRGMLRPRASLLIWLAAYLLLTLAGGNRALGYEFLA